MGGLEKITYDPIDDLVPNTGFIAKYLEWTRESEAPLRFQLATAMFLISAVLNRNVWIPFENRGTYPNLWFLLMGPSGCGKDTAINPGYDLYAQVKRRPRLIAEKITPEALVRAMGALRLAPDGQMIRDCRGVMFAPELSTFLGKVRYNEGLIPLLTRMYDCPKVLPTETIVRANITLRDVCLNALWGTTPDWYLKYMPESVREGGFTARVLFWFFRTRGRVIPNPRAFDPKLEAELVQWLDRMSTFHGPLTLSKNAREYWDRWYRSRPDPSEYDDDVVGTIARRPLMCKKLAIVLWANETQDGSTQILEKHLRQANALLDIIEREAIIGLRNLTGTDSDRLAKSIFRIISARPEGVPRTVVMQRSSHMIRGRREEFDRIIEWLLETNQIKEIRLPEGGKLCYRALTAAERKKKKKE